MHENDTEGVYYYTGRALPEGGVYATLGHDIGGVYADIQDGKGHPPCDVVAVLLLATLARVAWLLLSTL